MKRITTALFLLAFTGFTTSAMADDADIAGQWKTMNDAKIAASNDAKSKAMSQEVKSFAQLMVDEHTKNNKDSEALARKVGIQPKMESQDAKLLKADANRRLDAMKNLKGSQYDKAYIDAQVAMHRQSLRDLERKHISQAENPEFKRFLTSARDYERNHLDRAVELQTSLTGLAGKPQQQPSAGTTSGSTTESSGSDSMTGTHSGTSTGPDDTGITRDDLRPPSDDINRPSSRKPSSKRPAQEPQPAQ